MPIAIRKLLLILFLFLAPALHAQTINPNTPLAFANLNVQDSSTCSASSPSGSYLIQQLPLNSTTSVVSLSGTFSGTVTVYLSANNRTTWVAQSTTISNTTPVSYTTSGFTHICADVTTYTSGLIGVTINSNGGPGQGGGGGGGGGAPSGTAGGGLSGTYPNPTLGQPAAPNQNVIYVSPNCGTQTNCFPFVPGNCVTDAVTNGTATVTSASAHFQTTAHVGDEAWVVAAIGGNTGRCGDVMGITPVPYSGSPTVACGGGTTVFTISTINSDTSIALSSACTGTITSGRLYYGTNNYSSLSSACAAATNGAVDMPVGIYVLDNRALSTSNPSCQIGGFVSAIRGKGMFQTMLLTPPWYNHSFNFGSVIANTTCPSYASGFALDSTWSPITQSTDTPVDIGCIRADDVAWYGFEFSGVGNTEIFYTTQLSTFGGGPPGQATNNYIRNSYLSGGNNAAIGLNVGNSSNLELTNDLLVSANNVIEWEQSSSGGWFPITNTTMIGQNSVGGYQTLVTLTGARDNIIFTNTYASQAANVNVLNGGGNFQFVNSTFAGTATNNTAVNLTGGYLIAENSNFTGKGTGKAMISATGTGLYFDLADSFTGGVTFANGTVVRSPFNPWPFVSYIACAAGLEGYRIAVTDATVNTFDATITGGGSDHVSGYCDGTNWTAQ